MTQECSIDDCSREVFKETGKCALHCEKHSYSEDKESGLWEAFRSELYKYIRENNSSNSTSEIKFDKIYFPCEIVDELLYFCSEFKKIGRAHFNECDFVADKLKRRMDVTVNPETNFFFKNCTFHQMWEVDSPKILYGEKDIIYKECMFKDDVRVFSPTPPASDTKPRLICASLFNECSFHKNLVFNNFDLDISNFNTMFKSLSENASLAIMDCIIEEDLALEDRKINSFLIKDLKSKGINKLNNLTLNSFSIENSKFEKKFELNNLKTKKLLIKDTVFEGKVELGEGNVVEAKLDNTNFKKLFHSHSTVYGKFFCRRSIFSDFVGFEDGTFGYLQSKDQSEKIADGNSQSKDPSERMAIFEYVTFESVTNFRSAKFMQGLDLKKTNFEEYPNFLDSKIESDNTNRETFRIIKHSFDKIGNHIEANKFFAREMAKYKQDLSERVSKKGFFVKDFKQVLSGKEPKLWGIIKIIKQVLKGKYLLQERFIFWFNEKASNFGQSYIRPIGWIIVFAIVYYLLTLGHKNNLLYSFFSYSINKKITWLSCHLNGFAKSIIPFKEFFREGMEFVSLLFYIIFGTLIWLTIVAVKRHTRR